MTEEKKKFHHRHLPTLTKGSKSIGWKILHLYFPYIIHYLTDKYEDRHHHLIVDTIYATISVVLATVNIALVVWYVLFFTPAQIETHLFTSSEVVSGDRTELVFSYLNTNRDINNVQVELLLPDNIIFDGADSGRVIADLGDLQKNQYGTTNFSGIVYGSVGAIYNIKAVTTYESYNHRQHEITVHPIKITDSSFEVDVVFDKTTAYESVIEGVISYYNNSEDDLDEVQINIEHPSELTIESVSSENEMFNYNSEQHVISLGQIKSGGTGVVNIAGIFHYPDVETGIPGDSLVEVVIGASSDSAIDLVPGRMIHAQEYIPIELLAPPVITLLTGQEVMEVEEDLLLTLVLINVDEEAVEQISLDLELDGDMLNKDEMTIVENQGVKSEQLETINLEDDILHLPEQEKLNAGAQKRWIITIPTKKIDGQELKSVITVNGGVYSLNHQSNVALAEQRLETKYSADLQTTAQAKFYGENQKQIGTGPYPPQPWQTTRLRVDFGLLDSTNDLIDVHITAMLSDQVDWTNQMAVTTGTTLTWDQSENTIDWSLPEVLANGTEQTAQFYIDFTPNHLQIGESPNLISSIVLSATDEFTQQQISKQIDAVSVPVTIGEPAEVAASIDE